MSLKFKQHGAKWVPKVKFITYSNGCIFSRYLNPEELLKFAEEEGANDEIIKEAKIWKHRLSLFIPIVFGLWHEFTIIKSTNWYWSFEKNFECLVVQRSSNHNDVLTQFDGNKRLGEACNEGRWDHDIDFGENICNIIEWILNENELNNDYHMFRSNCHFFASRVYEAVTRTMRKRHHYDKLPALKPN
ncbi:unnamed protein product [Caenorhabditis bovis]|uniref:PPPDE domain-containing protein n=1 Tax=Caenorhabditis bovis TaxID=2654633 RepID=A0A8S1F6T7_9PELO|nr:unnamed protein product [Caenorhabditis bovis]